MIGQVTFLKSSFEVKGLCRHRSSTSNGVISKTICPIDFKFSLFHQVPSITFITNKFGHRTGPLRGPLDVTTCLSNSFLALAL